MEVQDVALSEPVVKELEGDVELVAGQVIGSVVRGDRRDPVMDDDFGVEGVTRGERRVCFCGGRDHSLGEDVERAGALLDHLPCFAAVHPECWQGGNENLRANA